MASKSLTTYVGAAFLVAAQMASALNFTIANGQIFTPGLVIVDAPQPGTPLGGGMSLSSPTHLIQGRLINFPRPHRSRPRRVRQRQTPASPLPRGQLQHDPQNRHLPVQLQNNAQLHHH